MTRPGQELAQRFNQALRVVEEQERKQAAAREARLEAARKARAQLFEDLGAFAEAVGRLQVQAKSHDEGLTIRYRERAVNFLPMGEGDRVEVRFTGSDDQDHRLYREPELQDRWVWVARTSGREDRLPLFDAGLEELLVRGLGLPRPDDVPAPESADASTLEDAIPSGRSL